MLAAHLTLPCRWHLKKKKDTYTDMDREIGRARERERRETGRACWRTRERCSPWPPVSDATRCSPGHKAHTHAHIRCTCFPEIYAHKHTYMHIYTHIHTYTCARAHTHTHINSHTCT